MRRCARVQGQPASGLGSPRMLLLTRAWHPELDAKERSALREFIRRGGEEEPDGYEPWRCVVQLFSEEMLPVPDLPSLQKSCVPPAFESGSCRRRCHTVLKHVETFSSQALKVLIIKTE